MGGERAAGGLMVGLRCCVVVRTVGLVNGAFEEIQTAVEYRRCRCFSPLTRHTHKHRCLRASLEYALPTMTLDDAANTS